jgi:hypothetical protein
MGPQLDLVDRSPGDAHGDTAGWRPVQFELVGDRLHGVEAPLDSWDEPVEIGEQ